MNVLLYILNVICASGQSTLSKQYAAKGGNATVFNMNKALSGFLFFLIFGILGGISLHIPSYLLGSLYGLSLCLSMYCGFKALSTGPMALTSIIASFSLIIPVLFGVVVLNEKLSAYSVTGMIFLIAAILLLNANKIKGGTSLKWSIYAFFTMITNGICSVIQKCHQLYYPGKYRTEFMMTSMLCVFLILIIVGQKMFRQNICKNICPSGIVSGILNGSANYIVLYLAAAKKASVLFPTLSIANIIVVWLIGGTVFKEKLKLLQMIGLISGIAAILFLNL